MLKFFLLEIDLERTKQDLRAVKHTAKLQAEVKATELNLLRKKLTHETELRNKRFPNTQLADSGCPSPSDPWGKQYSLC